MAALYLCLMESTYHHPGFCYLHQNRFPDRILCYIDGIAFAVVGMIAVIAALVAAVEADLSLLDNHVVH